MAASTWAKRTRLQPVTLIEPLDHDAAWRRP
jgi:hypothetical protein